MRLRRQNWAVSDALGSGCDRESADVLIEVNGCRGLRL